MSDSKSIAVVTNDGFRRWLRAWRPPWTWFFTLTEAEQEQLAILGDERSQDLILAAGYAAVDPELAEAGAAGDDEGEERLAMRMAVEAATRLVGRTATKPVDPPTTPPRMFGGPV